MYTAHYKEERNEWNNKQTVKTIYIAAQAFALTQLKWNKIQVEVPPTLIAQ